MKRRGAWIVAAICLASGGIAAQPSHDTCVDVQVGTAQSYACLNQKLQAVARQAHDAPAPGQMPATANSPSNETGQFNEAATRNRLGDQFGKSVTPERPPAFYTSPK